MWEIVQQRLKERRRKRSPKAKRVYLLSGLLKCGLCGGAYVGNSYRVSGNGKKYYLYACTTKINKNACNNKDIRQDVVESHVIDVVKRFVFNNDVIEQLVEEVCKYASKCNSEQLKEVKRPEAEKEKLQAKINRLLDLYLDESIDKASLQAKTKELKEQLEVIKRQIENTKIEDYSWITKDYVREYLHVLKKNFESEDPNLQKSVIETFVDEVIVYEESIKVTLKIDFLNVE